MIKADAQPVSAKVTGYEVYVPSNQPPNVPTLAYPTREVIRASNHDWLESTARLESDQAAASVNCWVSR